VIEAVAVASGYSDSGLAKANYTITPTDNGDQYATRHRGLLFPRTPLRQVTSICSTHGFSTTTRVRPAPRLDNEPVGTPSLSGNARQFDSSYTDNGGEIYSVV